MHTRERAHCISIGSPQQTVRTSDSALRPRAAVKVCPYSSAFRLSTDMRTRAITCRTSKTYSKTRREVAERVKVHPCSAIRTYAHLVTWLGKSANFGPGWRLGWSTSGRYCALTMALHLPRHIVPILHDGPSSHIRRHSDAPR